MNENFKKWPETKKPGPQRAEAQKHYDAQTQIIKQTLKTPSRRLNELLKRMRASNEAAVYLCGTRLDSEYGFGSNDLSYAISVLPQDGLKAAEPGYHPGSTEVYVVFQGSLVMEIVKQGILEAHNCGQFDVLVLPPGQCHRVRYEEERPAASFIIKTNPHHEPKVVRCKDCMHFADTAHCPLGRNWQKEEEKRKGRVSF